MKMNVSEKQRIRVMEGDWSPLSVGRHIVDGGLQEDPFYVMDVGEVVARYHTWRELMPRVEPFYAVKCNDDKLLVATLAALGTGFDCASKAEIELVTSIGVHPERIIFANPAKMASHIKYSARAGVDTMTFDSEAELMKIKQHMPHAQLVLRIRCDAAKARCPLGIKFGCDPVTEAPGLLKLAAVLGLQVIGVSFHVGSGTQETGVYLRAIQHSRAVFSLAADVGHANMRLLDIGGGFPGALHSDIREVSQVINGALETYFSDRSVRVIAEPGRYFAAAAYTLFAMVHSSRRVTQKDQEGVEQSHTMYFINVGVYGSFNCVLYDQFTCYTNEGVVAETIKPKCEKPQPCSVWGPSCDSKDCVLPNTFLPPLSTGDWLMFRDMGAYSLCITSAFNGFPVPKVRAVIDSSVWSVLKDLWPLSDSHFCRGDPMTGPQSADQPILPSPTGTPMPCLSHSTEPVLVECALK
ncbi:unnamed protein product [Chilo suppressalis]|uniref:ornithine decarboxylase n=1 Tax=Chilo suppressalis TaxID=168631 RepID=A0ABN8B298_CHISP|nr:unnamed protein product [Chilo suppressalis]